MRGHALGVGLAGLLAMATAAWPGAAQAGPVVIFNSLGDTANIHPEGITNFAGGAEAASFQTGAFVSTLYSLTLDLNCSGQNGNPVCGNGVGTYGNVEQVVYQTGASGGSNMLTLTGVTGVTVGSWIQGGGSNGILAGTTYVTAINGNTLTLSQPLTTLQAATLNSNGTSGRGVTFLQDGSFTVSLFASTTTGIPGVAASSASVPTGTALASFPVFDAGLYLQNNTITLPNEHYVAYSFNNMPFGSVTLSPSTTYWLELSNLTPGDPVNTNVGWEFLSDTNQVSNVGVNDEYWWVKNYRCPPSNPTNQCSQINGGSTDTISDGVFGMEITAPEPGTLSILGSALVGCGLLVRRRRGSSVARS